MKASRPHDEAMVELLREDAAFADEYLAASLEAMDEPGGREALLMALRQVAQEQGIEAMADRAGIQLESLYRALSSKGNPTLENLLATLHGARAALEVTTTEHPNLGCVVQRETGTEPSIDLIDLIRTRGQVEMSDAEWDHFCKEQAIQQKVVELERMSANSPSEVESKDRQLKHLREELTSPVAEQKAVIVSGPWWQSEYDLIELAQDFGKMLKESNKRPSQNAVVDLLVSHINGKERRSTAVGNELRSISATTLKKGPMKGWKYSEK